MKKHYQKPRVRTLRVSGEVALLAASNSNAREERQSNFTIEQWDDPDETDVPM